MGVFQSIGKHLLRTTVAGALLLQCTMAYVFNFVLPEFFGGNSSRNFEQQLLAASFSLAIAIFAGIPLALAGLSMTSAVVSQATYDFVVGSVPDDRVAYRRAFASAPVLFLVVLRVTLLASLGLVIAGGLMLAGGVITSRTGSSDLSGGLFIVVGFFAAFFGGLWFLWCLGSHALCPPIAMIEGGKFGQVLKRSRDLMRTRPIHGSGHGGFWTLAIVIFVVWQSFSFGCHAMVELLGTRAWLEGQLGNWTYAQAVLTAHDMFPDFVVTWTLIPFGAVAMTLLYIDRRVKLEGFDITLLARDAGRLQREVRFEL